MVKQDTSPGDVSGLGKIVVQDLKEAPHATTQGSDPKARARPGWMRCLDKSTDVALSVSMYLLYPAILLIILIDVIGRNFFHTPLSWAIEGSGLLLIGCIFLAVPKVELDKSHILLDILYANYSKKTKLVCDMLTRFVAFMWMLAATIRSSFEIPTSITLMESGADFRYPFWPMRVIMTIGFLLLTLSLLYNVIDSFQKLRKGGQD